MSQRNKLSVNSESSGTGTVRKDNHKFTKPSTPLTCNHRSKEKYSVPERPEQFNNQLLKGSSLAKQQNIPSINTSPVNVVQYSASDETAVMEVTVKTVNPPKQRLKSTVSAHEPWGQLLKKHKNGESESVFSNFDPLRTLHFLVKELQIHLEVLLPDERNIQEIVLAMHSALKRVPPEVASTIHLQQSIGLLSGIRKSSSQKSVEYEVPEKPFSLTSNKYIQTLPMYEETSKIQRLMEESTVKLETSCRHLETLCTQLKNEKIYLETQLENERSIVVDLRKKIEDIETVNKDLSHNLFEKNEEISRLKSHISALQTKFGESEASKIEIKSMVGELKLSKSSLEQECVKLKHQIRLAAIEKEKYLAILAVRDRQISEIRNEMTQLQEVVNDQLIGLHNNALAAMPSSASVTAYKSRPNRENVGDGIVPPVHINESDIYETDAKCPDKPKELQSGDCDMPSNVYPEEENQYFQIQLNEKGTKSGGCLLETGGVESRANINIREMFNELKKQAYALTSRSSNS